MALPFSSEPRWRCPQGKERLTQKKQQAPTSEGAIVQQKFLFRMFSLFIGAVLNMSNTTAGAFTAITKTTDL